MRKRYIYLLIIFSFFLAGTCYSNQLPSIKNVKVKAEVAFNSDTQIFTYSYTISNPIESELPIHVIVIDTTADAEVGAAGYAWNLNPHENGFEDPSEPFIEEDFPIDVPYKTQEEMVEKEEEVRTVHFGTFSPQGWTGSFFPEDRYTSILGVSAVARWGTNTPISPGNELSGFLLTSSVIPGIREIAFKPNIEGILSSGLVPEEWFPLGEDDPYLGIKMTKLYHNVEYSVCYKTKTIGPTPPPANFIPTEFSIKITNYLNDSLSLGWIIDNALAEILQNMLNQIYQKMLLEDYTQAQLLLQQFMELIQSSTTEQMSNEAKGLLYYNAKYLYEIIIEEIPLAIELQPLRSEKAINENQELVVTIRRGNKPVPDHDASATIITGPHEGEMWSGWTNSDGKFMFSYRGIKTGTDKIVASYIPPHLSHSKFANTKIQYESAPAYITWTGGPDLTLEDLFPPLIRIPSLVEAIPIKESTTNIGTTCSPPSKTRYYLSTDAIVDADDYVLGERDVSELPPEEISATEQSIPFPQLPEGFYLLLACADADNEIAELDEENNCKTLVTSIFFMTEPSANHPPDCSNATVEPESLWPPNHKLKSISINNVTDPDDDPITIEVSEIKQDEPVNGLGDGDTAPDGFLQPLKLRSERAGGGNGRVYHISFSATDDKGAQCSAILTVCVPHDQSPHPQCTDEGPLYDSTSQNIR